VVVCSLPYIVPNGDLGSGVLGQAAVLYNVGNSMVVI
jgi:hypothetical protein